MWNAEANSTAIATVLAAVVAGVGPYLALRWSKTHDLAQLAKKEETNLHLAGQGALLTGYRELMNAQQEQIDTLSGQLTASRLIQASGIEDRERLWGQIHALSQAVADCETRNSALVVLHERESSELRARLSTCEDQLATMRKNYGDGG